MFKNLFKKKQPKIDIEEIERIKRMKEISDEFQALMSYSEHDARAKRGM